MDDLKTKIDLPVWDNSISLWFYTRTDEGLSVSNNLVLEKVKPNELVTQEPIRLSRVSAQELMDQLWSVGLRPSEGTGSAGMLAATERHLDDMRALVFKNTPKSINR